MIAHLQRFVDKLGDAVSQNFLIMVVVVALLAMGIGVGGLMILFGTARRVHGEEE